MEEAGSNEFSSRAHSYPETSVFLTPRGGFRATGRQLAEVDNWKIPLGCTADFDGNRLIRSIGRIMTMTIVLMNVAGFKKQTAGRKCCTFS